MAAWISDFFLQWRYKLPAACLGLVWPVIIKGQEHPFYVHNLIVKDTAAIYTLIKRGEQYTNTDIDSAIYFLQEAKRLSLLTDFSAGVAESLMMLGLCYAYKGQNDRAITVIRDAASYCHKTEGRKKDKLLIRWYRNMATPYLYLEQSDSAIYYLQYAYDAAVQQNDTMLMLQINNNIGCAWLSNNRLSHGIRYLLRSEEIALQTKHAAVLPFIYHNISIAYRKMADTAQFYLYALKALDASYKESDIRNQRHALVSLGNYFLDAHQPQKAIRYFEEGLELADPGSPSTRFYFIWGLATAHFQLGAYIRARDYALEALSLVKQTDNMDDVNIYITLAKIYDALGAHKDAYHYYVVYASLKDSLKDLERNKALDRLEVRRKLAEKDKEIARKELELEKHAHGIRLRNTGIMVITSIAVLTGILLFIFFRSMRRKVFIFRQREEINKLKAMIAGEENERNRVARELHDGIGGLLSAAAINLNNLGDEYTPLVLNTTYLKTEQLLGEISNEVRKTANNLMPDVLLRHNLPDAVRLFCSYMAQGKALDIRVMTQGAFDRLDPDFLLSTYRIIQELVQNVVKHADAHNAFVQLHTNDSMISVTVEDDGKGYDRQTPAMGMGLQNIKRRVSAMHGRMSVDTGVARGTSVYIEFDL